MKLLIVGIICIIIGIIGILLDKYGPYRLETLAVTLTVTGLILGFTLAAVGGGLQFFDCPNCGYDYNTKGAYCQKCGKEIKTYCDECHYYCPRGAEYCPGCGREI